MQWSTKYNVIAENGITRVQERYYNVLTYFPQLRVVVTEV